MGAQWKEGERGRGWALPDSLAPVPLCLHLCLQLEAVTQGQKERPFIETTCNIVQVENYITVKHRVKYRLRKILLLNLLTLLRS